MVKILDNFKMAMGETYSLVSTNGTETTKTLFGREVSGPKVLLEFDTIDECTTSGSATATKYPTERGTYATDYKYKNPDTVTMVGYLSEGGATGFSSIYRRMGQWDRKSAIEAVRTNLNELVRTMTLLNIQTRNAGRRDNMTLIAYEINETYDNFGVMSVTMQFQQVPQYGTSTKVRNASDSDTADNGIMNTQSVLAIGAGALAITGAIIGGSSAALS